MRVTIDGVSKRYGGGDGRGGGGLSALHDVALTIEDGEFITVLGPSGCVKSTLLHVVAGLIPPTRGRVVFEAAPVDRPLSAVVFQDHALFPWRTVRDNVG